MLASALSIPGTVTISATLLVRLRSVNTYPIGRVCLPVTFVKEDNFRTEYLTLEVADFCSYYHASLGLPMLASFMAIPHHTYLIMKMTTSNRILSIYGDILVSYKCESDIVDLTKVFACKAAAMVMVAQASVGVLDRQPIKGSTRGR
jgi:hypothetical protein